MTSDATAAGRYRAGLGAAIREFVREPINLVLLVVLPPLMITSYGSMMSAFPEMPYMSTAPGTLGSLAGTLFVSAFLPGVIGLFQVISARRADDRLALAGFPRSTLFVSRLLAVVAASVLTAGMSVSVLATRTEVTAPLPAFLTLVVVGLLYGLIGMLIGAVLPRELEGSLVLIFLADMDEAMASGVIRTDSPVTDLFPLHYPHELFQAAVEGSAIVPGDALATLLYTITLLVLTLGAYTTLTGPGGVGG